MEIINWSPFFDASPIYLQVAKFLVDHEDEIEYQRKERKQGTTRTQQPILQHPQQEQTLELKIRDNNNRQDG